MDVSRIGLQRAVPEEPVQADLKCVTGNSRKFENSREMGAVQPDEAPRQAGLTIHVSRTKVSCYLTEAGWHGKALLRAEKSSTCAEASDRSGCARRYSTRIGTASSAPKSSGGQ